MKTENKTQDFPLTCMSRRSILLAGAAGAATLFISPIMGFEKIAVAAEIKGYPEKRICGLDEAKLDTPIFFNYPDVDETYAGSFLVKLGVEAGYGVGPQKDIVAFNGLCTHMGGILTAKYNAKHKAVGPCPTHLSTFDLTRHGMIIAGHATESLPQVILKVRDGDILATGMLGLIFGREKNLKA